MSQLTQLNIYFVLPTEDKNAECSKDMYDAFSIVKQYKEKAQWVLPSFCMTYAPAESDVFVFEEFKGPAFERLRENSAKILGAKCLAACISAGSSLPAGTSPVFNEAMSGLIVCCTGFDENTKNYVKEKVEYMGGLYDSVLRRISTHVVAANILSIKTIQAFKCDIPVMKLNWIEEVWKVSQDLNVRGDDKQFDKYKAPIFHNLNMSTSGLSSRKKAEIKQIVTEHGGVVTGELDNNKTNVLLISKPVGEKYNAAKKWNIKVIKPEWIYACLEVKKTVDFRNYLLNEQVGKTASTPEKGHVDLTANFSLLSAINHEMPNFTHLEETVNSVTDGTLTQNIQKDDVKEIINNLVLNLKTAGQFLDGCNIYLAGFSQDQLEKLKKILNFGGATRLDELSASVTHVVAHGNAENSFKGCAAHVVTIGWLWASMELKKPAPIEKYLTNKGCIGKVCPPSPMSKQGALLLSRPEVVELPPRRDIEPEDDLVNRYNLSQQGEPLEQREAEKFTPMKASQHNHSLERSQCTLTEGNVFAGLKFFLSEDLSEEEKNAEDYIIKEGGVVVSKKFSGVPDYAIVPVAGGTLIHVTPKEVVTLFFIKDCIIAQNIVPVSYYHQPITWVVGSKPLEGCVLSVSKYVNSEREFLETIIETIGGVVQAVLVRKPKTDLLKTTHLICDQASGVKYNGALRWGLPIVHHKWLLKCAEVGSKVSEEPYLIGDTNLTGTKTPSSKDGCSKIVSSTKTIDDPATKMNSTLSSSKTPGGVNLTADKEDFGKSNISAPQESDKASKVGKDQGLQVFSNVSVRRKLLNTPEAPTNKSSSLNRSKQNSPVPAIAQKIALELPQATPSQKSYSPSAAAMEENFLSPFNRVLEKVRQLGTPKSLDSSDCSNKTATPTSPYGAFYGNDNPSPATRKRLYRWMNQGADFPVQTTTKPPTVKKIQFPNVSSYLTEQFNLMKGQTEELDDAPSPMKRPHLELDSDSKKNDIMSGLQKMRDIEESFSKTTSKVIIKTSNEPKEVNDMMIIAQSQPFTEIGWEDPSDKEAALASLERAAKQVQLAPKIFMISSLSDKLDEVKKLIEDSGGRVSKLSYFDKTATHLIAGSVMTKAEKLMGSVASGLWIIHPSYIEQLKITKDVYAINEEDFEWGNPLTSFSHSLEKSMKETIDIGYARRIDITKKDEPLPFHGMKIILAISSAKADSFRRLVEAGGGEVVSANEKKGENVFCVCDISTKTDNFHEYARNNIRCVSLMFISDVILKKPGAISDNMVPSFRDIWNKTRT